MDSFIAGPSEHRKSACLVRDVEQLNDIRIIVRRGVKVLRKPFCLIYEFPGMSLVSGHEIRIAFRDQESSISLIKEARLVIFPETYKIVYTPPRDGFCALPVMAVAVVIQKSHGGVVNVSNTVPESNRQLKYMFSAAELILDSYGFKDSDIKYFFE